MKIIIVLILNNNNLQVAAGLIIGVIIGVTLFSFIGTPVSQEDYPTITLTTTATTTINQVTTITDTSIISTTLTTTTTVTNKEMIIDSPNLLILSPSFKDNENIPVKFVCSQQGGQNVSPKLVWNTPPEGTQSITLIMDDPDALNSFTHWVLFNLPADITELSEAVPSQNILDNGGYHGNNDLGRVGYFGPCPPSGIHGYKFRLYALDTMLSLDVGASKQEVLTAMNGHILDESLLTGKFGN